MLRTCKIFFEQFEYVCCNLPATKLFNSSKQPCTPLLFISRDKWVSTQKEIPWKQLCVLTCLWLALICIGYFSYASCIFGVSLNVQNVQFQHILNLYAKILVCLPALLFNLLEVDDTLGESTQIVNLHNF